MNFLAEAVSEVDSVVCRPSGFGSTDKRMVNSNCSSNVVNNDKFDVTRISNRSKCGKFYLVCIAKCNFFCPQVITEKES